jgi:chromosome segregation ATPase
VIAWTRDQAELEKALALERRQSEMLRQQLQARTTEYNTLLEQKQSAVSDNAVLQQALVDLQTQIAQKNVTLKGLLKARQASVQEKALLEGRLAELRASSLSKD